MSRPKPTFARERTALAWQRTGLDFVLVSVLLLRAAGGLDRPVRVMPAAVAALVAAAVIVHARTRRRGVGTRDIVTLGGATVLVGLLAAVLVLA